MGISQKSRKNERLTSKYVRISSNDTTHNKRNRQTESDDDKPCSDRVRLTNIEALTTLEDTLIRDKSKITSETSKIGLQSKNI